MHQDLVKYIAMAAILDLITLIPPLLTNVCFFPDHNNCEPDLCENGGICTDDHNDYDCACLPGWKGKRCDQGLNYY